MTIQEQKNEWYLKNKDFLRKFESTPAFLSYRSQRNRVLLLKRTLLHEQSILSGYYNKMIKAKEEFSRNYNQNKE